MSGHLKIKLEDIKSATNDFNESQRIGKGGYGKVYKGELPQDKEGRMAAFKRLDPLTGQGDTEFNKEIMTLAGRKHENIISLLGFCKEDNERVLVYELASRGSLDLHLNSATVTWARRLKICLAASKGLNFIHDANGRYQRVIHCDIKSANILLDDKWNAKVSDFGLSEMAPANQEYSFIYKDPSGTLGYIDPVYLKTHKLTKESDVYSFGVVLFEVLCGRLCYKYDGGVYKDFVTEWTQACTNHNLNGIICEDLIMQQRNPSSLKVFLDIASRCLKESREERPKMDEVVEQLEIALALQEYKETLTDAERQISEEDHQNDCLSKGILINDGKTWFSVNKDNKHCEMISIAECLIPSESENYKSRFTGGFYEASKLKFKTKVRTKFLSPLTTYTVNLIFKNKKPKEQYIGLEYSLEGGKKCYSFVSDMREDGWFTAELYQFKSEQRTVDLQILFDLKYCPTLLIEGIEFQPMEEVEHATLKDDKVNTPDISESDTYWNDNEPSNLRDGKKGLMLPTRASLKEDRCRLEFLTETSFEEVASDSSLKYKITCEFETKNLLPDSTYATCLIYKQESKNAQPRPAQVKDAKLRSGEPCHIYLCTPQTPVIKKSIDKQSYNPSQRPKMKGLPKLRNDGWMEVQIWEFQTNGDAVKTIMHLELYSYDKSALKGLEVRGAEFRPI